MRSEIESEKSGVEICILYERSRVTCWKSKVRVHRSKIKSESSEFKGWNKRWEVKEIYVF